jgi:hypothetical protein
MAAGLTSHRSAAICTCPRLAVGDRNLPPVLARIWHDGHGPALVFSRPSIAAGTIERWGTRDGNPRPVPLMASNPDTHARQRAIADEIGKRARAALRKP